MLSKMTLKHAKELSKKHIGRLPRAGWEYIIYSDNHYRLTLENTSGKLSLREWLSVNSSSYQHVESSNKADAL